MSLSGVTVSDQVITAYNELKTKKASRFLILVIENEKEVVIGENCTDRAASWESFVAKLPSDAPCYAIFDYEWNTPDGKRDKILFISWNPDNAKIKQKMLYASTKGGVTQSLQGGYQEIAASDDGDLSVENLMIKLSMKR